MRSPEVTLHSPKHECRSAEATGLYVRKAISEYGKLPLSFFLSQPDLTDNTENTTRHGH